MELLGVPHLKTLMAKLLPNNVASINKGGTGTIIFTVTCDEPVCSSGDVNEVTIYGKARSKILVEVEQMEWKVVMTV